MKKIFFLLFITLCFLKANSQITDIWDAGVFRYKLSLPVYDTTATKGDTTVLFGVFKNDTTKFVYWFKKWNVLPITQSISATASGDGSATYININLPASATWVSVQSANAAADGIRGCTVSGTTLTIRYEVAPANGTNNLSYYILYR